jgi:hypothetical protein
LNTIAFFPNSKTSERKIYKVSLSLSNMGTDDRRLTRVKVLQRSITECCNAGLTANKELLINEMSLAWGISRDTAIDYLSSLLHGKRIKEVSPGEYDIVTTKAEDVQWLRDLRMRDTEQHNEDKFDFTR